MPVTEIANRPQQHHLEEGLLNKTVQVVVVGCGGTGSAIAAGLPTLHQAMLHQGHPGGLRVLLVDGDRISRTNCVRQPFSESEIGMYKAEVLAHRINLFWGLGWEARSEYIDTSSGFHSSPDLLISCVDTRAARKTLLSSSLFWDCCYWLDLGNSASSGQFVLGQPDNRRNKRLGAARLPTVNELYPEIVDAKLDREDTLPACSAIEALERQEPFVNQTLAYLALALLARLFRYGSVRHHGGFVNLESGRMASLAVPA